MSAIASSQVRQSSGPVVRWSDQQTLFFLSLLLEARRQHLLESTKTKYLREGLQTLIPRMVQRFPGRPWEIRTLENKYQYLKKYWRVFAAAEKISGTSYDPATGKLSMSEQNEGLVTQRYGAMGRRVVSIGLLVGDGITFESWLEVFSNDLPAGENIVEAGDEAAFARDSQNASFISPSPPALLPAARSSSSRPTLSSQPSSSRPTPSTPRAASARPSQRSSITPSAAFRANSLAARKKKAARSDGISQSFRELTSALIARDSQPQQQQEHYVTHNQRTVGAEDFEKAIRDCFAFAEGRGMLFASRLVQWIRQDPLNPLIWNSMPSDEAKEAWVAINFPPNS
ncbi:hypothetical protein M419DRAFT_97673 [Trichoderma reesei RUT C-30]|uniref:Myb/SANT-like domain-containing protein n=1 Tax=Hypocrea jecorina (strain ATCC 56765 / BCRC 32924 / NRRL 11460 / Rut C-30) TaxID=1344414 RepID=A0A024SDW1_HYPJR|nr:hypothetical protein M419DRAFT_97673 [Trichoderma reesei RUT C-30]